MHILSTPRLDLRTLELSDAEFFLELTNSPGWLKNIGDKGLRTLQDAEHDIQTKSMKMQEDLGFSLYVIELLDCKTPLGLCGLVKRDNFPAVDIGYALLPQYQGCGYASEAAAAVRDYARVVLGLRRLLGITAPGNLASAKILRKLGMALQPDEILYGDQPSLLFAMDFD